MNDSPQNQSERLAVVETKLTALTDTVNKMDQKLDIMASTFVTQADLSEKLRDLDKEIADTKTVVNDIRRKGPFISWATGTFGLIVGTVLTFLIESYFRNR